MARAWEPAVPNRKILAARLTDLGFPLRVVTVYVVVAGLWILLSAPLLGALVHEKPILVVFEIAKGWLFVLITALLLYWLIRRGAEALRRSEQALKDSEEQHRLLVKMANDAIFVADAESGIILDVNHAAEELMGRPATELVGLHQTELHPPEDTEQYGQLFHIHAKSGGVLQDGWVQHNDGHRVPVEISACTIDLGGRRIVQGIFRDVTERNRAEAERRTFEAQIQHAQRLESLGVLAGGIAHDFNNLLAGVMGNASLAQRVVPPESPAREMLEDIETASQRAAELTSQLLAYSGKGRFLIQPLDLSQIVEGTARLLDAAVSKKAELCFHCAEGLPAVSGDPSQLRQVVMNLITNASDALGDHSGVIRITTGVVDLSRRELRAMLLGEELQAGCYVFLEVADTGTGMDKDMQNRIFEPFFSTKFTGRGLGLAAVLGILRGHQGAIRLESTPKQGTTFTVFFPCQEDTAPALVSAKSSDQAWHASGTVLVADDEAGVRTFARRVLESCGFAVVEATDGREAVDVFRQCADTITAVLLDMTMPKLGGHEALRKFADICSDVPVILSSGYTEEHAIKDAGSQHVAAFIQKPYGARALIDTLKGVLGA